MRRARPCTVCGAKTTGFLFNDKWLGIPLCSKKCENEYFGTLTPNRREQMNKLRYINDLMDTTKRHEAICWIIAGFGLLMITTAFLTTNEIFFFLGVFPLTCGAISTSHFEKQLIKLTRQKRQIAI